MKLELSNWAMYLMLVVALLALLERMLSRYMSTMVKSNLSAADMGQPSPFSMRDWRKVWKQRRAARVAVSIGLAFLLISTAYQTAQAEEQGRIVMAQYQRNIPLRNTLLARAEKMARQGHKGLMRANIKQARRFGPVDILMQARIEGMLVK